MQTPAQGEVIPYPDTALRYHRSERFPIEMLGPFYRAMTLAIFRDGTADVRVEGSKGRSEPVVKVRITIQTGAETIIEWSSQTDHEGSAEYAAYQTTTTTFPSQAPLNSLALIWCLREPVSWSFPYLSDPHVSQWNANRTITNIGDGEAGWDCEPSRGKL